MTEEQYPTEEDVQNDTELVVAAFKMWQTGIYPPEEFIRRHRKVCQYIASQYRGGGCPHPDIGTDHTTWHLVSTVNITASLLEKGVACRKSAACFAATVLAKAGMVE